MPHGAKIAALDPAVLVVQVLQRLRTRYGGTTLLDSLSQDEDDEDLVTLLILSPLLQAATKNGSIGVGFPYSKTSPACDFEIAMTDNEYALARKWLLEMKKAATGRYRRRHQREGDPRASWFANKCAAALTYFANVFDSAKKSVCPPPPSPP